MKKTTTKKTKLTDWARAERYAREYAGGPQTDKERDKAEASYYDGFRDGKRFARDEAKKKGPKK